MYKNKKSITNKSKAGIQNLITLIKCEDGPYWWRAIVTFFFMGFATSVIFYFCLPYLKPLSQLWLTRLFLSIQLVYLSIFFIVNHTFILKKVKKFLFEPVLPYSISLTRVLFFTYLLFLYLNTLYDRSYLVEGLEKVSLPGIGWLIKILPVSAEYYTWMCYAGALTCFFIVIGFKTRFFLFINALIIFYVVATPNFFGKLWHNQLVIWISWLMAFSACYDVLSLDSCFKKTSLAKSFKYGFHLKVIWLHFGVIYFFAGFFKLWLCGFDWALSSSMVNQVRLEWFEHYNRVPAFRVDHWPKLLKFGGLLVILFELFYFTFLLHKKTRWISAIGGLIMHNAIGYIMYIPFRILLQMFYLVFIPWNAILIKLNLIKEPLISKQDVNFSFKKWTIFIPLFILGMNVMHGVFQINSYPFSIYPIYAAIVPSTFKYFKYEVLDEEFKNLKVHELGKANNFNWENYSRFEPEIIEEYEVTGKLDTAKVIQQWNRWQVGIPLLQNVDSVSIYVIEISLNPDEQQDTISKQYLYSITSPNND